MITSIFSKSKPINFIIVFFVTLIAFLMARVEVSINQITIAYLFKQLSVFFLCIIIVLVFNFILNKNSLTKHNHHEILIFSLFFLTIVETTTNTNILLSNFFVLLGLRRIISLRTQKNVKKKLFDASTWIVIASLFYFWAILFFVIIISSLILYTDNNFKHWIIPFVGSATILLITVSISIVFYDEFFEVFKLPSSVSYDFSKYNSPRYLVAITMIISYGVWSSIFYIRNIKNKKKAFRTPFKIVLISALVAFLIVIQAPQKTGSEFLFIFAPLSIIITNYIETIKEKWFKEVFLLVLILVPFVLLML